MKKSILTNLLCSLFFVSAAFAGSPTPPLCGNSGGTFIYGGAPISISSGAPNVITSTINVSGLPPFLWDVDVTTLLNHTSSADIDMTITSPSGTVVTLTTDNGTSLDNVFAGTLWDDQANPGGQVPYTFNNGLANDHTYTNGVAASALAPEEPLSAFYGENPNGVWTLTISDDSNTEGGALNNWALDIVSLKSAPVESLITFTNDTDVVIPTGPATVSSQITVNDPAPAPLCRVEVNTKITHTFPGDIDMTVSSPSGRVVTLTTDNGGTSDNVFANTTWTNQGNLGGQVPYINNAGLATDHPYVNLVNVPILAPEESLQSFASESTSGNWKLTISDDASADGGNLDSWTLNLYRCSEPDTDGDGARDSCDACPNDAGKTSPGTCGCGVSDADSDGDGVINCLESCPNDSKKFSPGQCGCGVADVDSDFDGTVNCLDQCPSDLNKKTPGQCGCGVADSDTNVNGVVDCFAANDLNAQLDAASKRLAKIKKGSNGKLSKSAKTAKTELNAILKDIARLVSSNSAQITVSGKKSLTTLNKTFQSKLKKAVKTLDKNDRKAAISALKSFKKGIGH